MKITFDSAGVKDGRYPHGTFNRTAGLRLPKAAKSENERTHARMMHSLPNKRAFLFYNLHCFNLIVIVRTYLERRK